MVRLYVGEHGGGRPWSKRCESWLDQEPSTLCDMTSMPASFALVAIAA